MRSVLSRAVLKMWSEDVDELGEVLDYENKRDVYGIIADKITDDDKIVKAHSIPEEDIVEVQKESGEVARIKFKQKQADANGTEVDYVDRPRLFIDNLRRAV